MTFNWDKFWEAMLEPVEFEYRHIDGKEWTEMKLIKKLKQENEELKQLLENKTIDIKKIN